MEHAASGFYPTLAHGRGLATLYPAYFRWLWEKGRAHDRMAKLASRLFGIKENNEKAAAMMFIEEFEKWLQVNGLYQSFPDLGVMPEKYAAIAEYTIQTYGFGAPALDALGTFSKEDIIDVFQRTEKQSKSVLA
jgi:alcohol dehydrogenase YqhD (iron-dependent ADH family)